MVTFEFFCALHVLNHGKIMYFTGLLEGLPDDLTSFTLYSFLKYALNGKWCSLDPLKYSPKEALGNCKQQFQTETKRTYQDVVDIVATRFYRVHK